MKTNYGVLTPICQQGSEDALRAPQMALRISLKLLFIGCVRPSKCTLVIDRPKYGRLCVISRVREPPRTWLIRRRVSLTCDAGAPDDRQYGMPKWLIVLVGYKADSGPEHDCDRVRYEGTRATTA